MLLDTPNALLFFLSALGILNGFVLAALTLFWIKEPKLNILLSGLFIFLTIRIGKSVALYFVPGLSQIIIQIGLSACVMIGPLLYLSIKCKTNRLKRMDYLYHFVAPLLILVVVGGAFPFEQHPDIWRNAHKVIYHYWLIYLVLSALELNRFAPFKTWNKLTWDSDEFLLVSIFSGNVLVWFSMYSFKYTSYIAGAVTFSFVTYLLLLFLSAKLVKSRLHHQSRKKKHSVPSNESQALDGRLQALIAAEKFYADPNLSLPKLARKLGTSTHQLSSHMNSVYGINFTTWLNDFRISEAKSLLIDQPRLSVEVISEMSGFNSTSTFYNAFKKITGTTPSKFREGKTI